MKETCTNIKTESFEEQGWNLANYAFSKKELKPTVYYDETLDCTLFFDNQNFYCFDGANIDIEVYVIEKEPDGTFGLFSEDTFAACEMYIGYVIGACEGDLDKVMVHTLDFDGVPLSSIIGFEDY
jgi:hypothetical protein